MATKKKLKEYARKMRKNPTKSEEIAEKALRKAKIPIRVQVPFKYYILDFIISNRLLVLEIDGGYHKERTEKDKIRDSFCKKMGLKVLRINNEDVDTVIKRVRRFKKISNYQVKLNKILNNL